LAVSHEPEDVMRDFERFHVWQKAHRLVLDLCRDT
jgi:hypothetical protein